MEVYIMAQLSVMDAFLGILLGILAFSFKNIGYALQKSGVNKAGAVQSENPEDNTTTDQAAQKILKTPIWWIGQVLTLIGAAFLILA